MLTLQIIAANIALVVGWLAALFLLGFRAIPMQIGLLALGLITSSILVTRGLIERDRQLALQAAPVAEASAEA